MHTPPTEAESPSPSRRTTYALSVTPSDRLEKQILSPKKTATMSKNVKDAPSHSTSTTNGDEEIICLSSDEEEGSSSSKPSVPKPVAMSLPQVKTEPGAATPSEAAHTTNKKAATGLAGISTSDLQGLLKQLEVPGLLQNLLQPNVPVLATNNSQIEAQLEMLRNEEQRLQQLINQSPQQQQQNRSVHSPSANISRMNNYNCQIFTLPSQTPLTVVATTNMDSMTSTTTLRTQQQANQSQNQIPSQNRPAHHPIQIKAEFKPVLSDAVPAESARPPPLHSTHQPTPNASRPIKTEDMTTVIECCLCPDQITAPSRTAASDAYTAHLMSHLEIMSEEKNCPRCASTFGDKANMVEHFLKTHGMLQKLQCPQCPRQFWLRKSFNRHAETHIIMLD